VSLELTQIGINKRAQNQIRFAVKLYTSCRHVLSGRDNAFQKRDASQNKKMLKMCSGEKKTQVGLRGDLDVFERSLPFAGKGGEDVAGVRGLCRR
jgi:hypothetical protein